MSGIGAFLRVLSRVPRKQKRKIMLAQLGVVVMVAAVFVLIVAPALGPLYAKVQVQLDLLWRPGESSAPGVPAR